MKKITIVALAFIIGIAVIFFFFYSQKSKNTQSVIKQLAPSSSAVYRLKFGHDMPESSAQHLAAERFADIVDYKSNGRVKIDVFPNQQLGTDQQMLEMARSGKLAIILPPTSKMTTLVPEMQVLDLFFLFPDRECLYEMLDGKPGRALLEKLTPHGLVGISFWESGFKQFSADRPIRTPGDFQGLNIRVMKSQTIMEQFKAFGANPIPIDFHRTYQALKDKGVDGQENPLISIAGMKFYEVQSHITLSNHGYLAQALVFSQAVLDTLPVEVQDMLIDTGREIASFERKEIIENEEKLLNIIRAAGTRVIHLDEEERAVFRRAAEKIRTDFRLKKGGDILAMIEDSLHHEHQTKENEIVIGLNADMVAGSALSGQAIKRGMELAVGEINQRGGLLDKKLKIVVRDNSGISTRGRDNMNYFIGMDNVVAVMCGIYSPIALAELDIIHREKMIFLVPWAAATRIVDNGFYPNYVFRVSVRDEYAGPFLIQKALEKYKKIALLLVNDGWGRGNLKSMSGALSQKKMEAVSIQWFSWGEKDMTLQLDSIERAGADVIVMVAGATEGASIIKNMAMRPHRLPIISHWGITGGHFWKAVNRELEKVNLSFLQSFSFFKAETREARSLMEKYFKAYDVDHPGRIFAPVGTAHAYDLVHLLALAIKKAGTTDRPFVRYALERLDDYSGVVKRYSPPFTPGRHDALEQSSFFLCEYDQQGYIIPISE